MNPTPTTHADNQRAEHTPTSAPSHNPFNGDLVAALDSPVWRNGETRIAFSDEENGIEGHVYAESHAMAVARANFAVAAINSHASLVAALEKQIKHTEQLASMANGFAQELGLGNKVNVADWTDLARQALASAKGETRS